MSRQRRYFLLMGICLTLIVVAWNVVRFYSTAAAIVMSVIAMFIPPIAVIVGNRSDSPRRQRAPRHRW